MADMSTAVAEPVVAPAAATPPAPATTPPAAAGAPAASPVASTPAPAGAPAAAPAATTILSEAPKPADPAKPDAAAKPVDAATWELKAPEGATLSADEVKAAEKFAKDNGLTQAQAEKILARDIESRAAMQSARQAEAASANDTWLKETQADPDIGGAKLPQTVANVRKALTAIYSPEERALIEKSPFINNRIFVKALNAIGATRAEDSLHPGQPGGGATDMHPARILYGNR